MSDTTEPQTLDEVMDAATADPQEAPEAQPETPQTSQEAEESYTRIDPKSLPPELQAMHKSLLRDYTKKTQALAQQRKELEALRTQPQAEAQKPQVSTLPDAPNENMSVEEYTAFMLAKVEEKLTAQQQQILDEQNQKYLDKAVTEFEATDERLNPENPAYDEYMRNAVGLKLDEALAEYTEQNNGSPIGFDYQGKTSELIEQYEKHMENRAKSIAEAKTKQAFQGVKRTAATSVASSQAPSKPAGRMSLDEAIDSAFSE